MYPAVDQEFPQRTFYLYDWLSWMGEWEEHSGGLSERGQKRHLTSLPLLNFERWGSEINHPETLGSQCKQSLIDDRFWVGGSRLPDKSVLSFSSGRLCFWRTCAAPVSFPCWWHHARCNKLRPISRDHSGLVPASYHEFQQITSKTIECEHVVMM